MKSSSYMESKAEVSSELMLSWVVGWIGLSSHAHAFTVVGSEIRLKKEPHY